MYLKSVIPVQIDQFVVVMKFQTGSDDKLADSDSSENSEIQIFRYIKYRYVPIISDFKMISCQNSTFKCKIVP